jgi:hypothetical protein
MTAFVLGNGQSRDGIDINRLLELGAVYGCNALYRTHTPTVLVATDKPISEQIQQSGYSKKHRFYTRRPLPNSGALPVPAQYFGYSSGPLATAIAAINGHNPIYMLGFDMGPGEDGRFNNIYAGTEFYKPTGSVPTFVGNWVKQITTVTIDFKHQKFIRVHGKSTAKITELETITNLENLSLADFLIRINTGEEL